MEWKRAIREERAALGRIVALLCALAGLAERAAGRSAIVRRLVLLFLRRAEAVAREFVDGCPASMPVPPASGAPADALRLAASLRSLARQLDRQARSIIRRCRDDRAESPCPGPIPAILDHLHGLPAIVAPYLCRLRRVPAPDTS